MRYSVQLCTTVSQQLCESIWIFGGLRPSTYFVSGKPQVIRRGCPIVRIRASCAAKPWLRSDVSDGPDEWVTLWADVWPIWWGCALHETLIHLNTLFCGRRPLTKGLRPSDCPTRHPAPMAWAKRSATLVTPTFVFFGHTVQSQSAFLRKGEWGCSIPCQYSRFILRVTPYNSSWPVPFLAQGAWLLYFL